MGGTRSGVWFELTTSAEGEPPFVVLDDSGRFSRVLLGRVCTGADDTLLDVAVKVQRDAYLVGSADDAMMTNDAVDDMWRRELDDHRKARSEHVVPLLDLTGGMDQSPPVLYCREQQAWFHPPSPQTGEPLRVCRDDGLLQDSGLRAYKRSLQRYLGGAPTPSGGPRVFYKRGSLDEERPRPDVTVRVGAELFADLAPVAHGEVAAQAWFPCATCGERDRCYPRGSADQTAGLAKQRLVPLSFYDFAFALMPAQQLAYDELCEVLGGRSWAEVKQRLADGSGKNRLALVAGLDRRLGSGRQWLARRDDGLALALEVLRAKLFALHDVASGMAAVHRACGRPHLGVEPRNLVARIADGGHATPARWGARVQMIDLGAARRFIPAHASRKDAPLRFVPDAARAYRAPSTRNAEGVAGFAQVRVEKVTAAQDGKQVALRALFAPDFKLGDYRPGDLVRVMLTADQWVWAEVVEIARATATLVANDPPAGADTLLAAQREFNSHVWIHKVFGPACDLYGFGLLLFRTLLANDDHPATRVEEVVARCAERLMTESDERDLSPVDCRAFLTRKMGEHDDLFLPAAVLFDRKDRARVEEGFPAGLWADLLAFGFRLMTTVPGFSLADSHEARNPHDPGLLAAQVQGELHDFAARVHAELFSGDARAREIEELCRGMLAQARDDMLGQSSDSTQEGHVPEVR